MRNTTLSKNAVDTPLAGFHGLQRPPKVRAGIRVAAVARAPEELRGLGGVCL
jgi:hypothetical protein